MPFTLAHPAAVLPFLRTRLVFSALVAGSIAPDLEYFLRMTTSDPVGHSLPGIFWFTVPAGLVALAVWHWVLKRPLVDLLPEAHRRKLLPYCGPFHFGPPRRFLLIALSVFLGALTHVGWDSFTHSTGYFPRNYPALQEDAVRLPYMTLPWTRTLQHLSTAVGFTVLGIAYLLWFRRAREESHAGPSPLPGWARVSIIAGLLLVAVTVGLLYAWPQRDPLASMRNLRFFSLNMTLSGLNALAVGLLLFSTWWRFALASPAASPEERA